MIDTESSEEYYIYVLLHVLGFFIILYCYYYIAEYDKYENLLTDQTLEVLDDKKIYEAFTLKNSDKTTVDAIKKINKVRNREAKFAYPLYLNLLIFLIAIVSICRAINIYWRRLRRIFYESILAFIYLLTVKVIFTRNVSFRFDNVSENEIYNVITKILEKNIK